MAKKNETEDAAELETLRADNANLAEENAALKSNVESLTTENAALKSEVATLTKERDAAEVELSALRASPSAPAPAPAPKASDLPEGITEEEVQAKVRESAGQFKRADAIRILARQLERKAAA